jgi:hypothetical protein
VRVRCPGLPTTNSSWSRSASMGKQCPFPLHPERHRQATMNCGCIWCSAPHTKHPSPLARPQLCVPDSGALARWSPVLRPTTTMSRSSQSTTRSPTSSTWCEPRTLSFLPLERMLLRCLQFIPLHASHSLLINSIELTQNYLPTYLLSSHSAHARTHARARARTHTHTHTHTDAHTHTHTHTYTHTHTHISPPPPLPP